MVVARGLITEHHIGLDLLLLNLVRALRYLVAGSRIKRRESLLDCFSSAVRIATINSYYIWDQIHLIRYYI